MIEPGDAGFFLPFFTFFGDFVEPVDRAEVCPRADDGRDGGFFVGDMRLRDWEIPKESLRVRDPES